MNFIYQSTLAGRKIQKPPTAPCRQSLGRVPGLGSDVAAWPREQHPDVLDLWWLRLPWCRGPTATAGGGFERDGQFYPMARKRVGRIKPCALPILVLPLRPMA